MTTIFVGVESTDKFRTLQFVDVYQSRMVLFDKLLGSQEITTAVSLFAFIVFAASQIALAPPVDMLLDAIYTRPVSAL
jgi:hypothetical protein